MDIITTQSVAKHAAETLEKKIIDAEKQTALFVSGGSSFDVVEILSPYLK